MAGDDLAFWDFSVDAYARAGVADACLMLQDQRGLDVNLVLYCVWSAVCGRALGDADCIRARDEVVEWQRQVVGPLRAARRALKSVAAAPPGASSLRDRVKALELEAERLEQQQLTELPVETGGAAQPTRPLDTAATNLRRFLVVAAVPLDEDVAAGLIAILAGCFPERSAEQVEAAVR